MVFMASWVVLLDMSFKTPAAIRAPQQDSDVDIACEALTSCGLQLGCGFGFVIYFNVFDGGQCAGFLVALALSVPLSLLYTCTDLYDYMSNKYKQIHRYIYIYIYTYIHTYIHTYIDTYIHTVDRTPGRTRRKFR